MYLSNQVSWRGYASGCVWICLVASESYYVNSLSLNSYLTVPCQHNKKDAMHHSSYHRHMKNAVHLTHGKAVLQWPFEGISQVHADEQ